MTLSTDATRPSDGTPLEQARCVVAEILAGGSQPSLPYSGATSRAMTRARETLLTTSAWLSALGVMKVHSVCADAAWPPRTPLGLAVSDALDSPPDGASIPLPRAVFALTVANASTWFTAQSVLCKQTGIALMRAYDPQPTSDEVPPTHLRNLVCAIALHDLIRGEEGATYRQVLDELPSAEDVAWALGLPPVAARIAPAEPTRSPEPLRAPPEPARDAEPQAVPPRPARMARAARSPDRIREAAHAREGRAEPAPAPSAAPIPARFPSPLHYATTPADWATDRGAGQGMPGHWLRVSCWDGDLIEHDPGALMREIAGAWVTHAAEACGIATAPGALRAEGERHGSGLESILLPSGVLRIVATDGQARGRPPRLRIEATCTPRPDAPAWQIRLECFVLPGSAPLGVLPLHPHVEAFFRHLAAAGAVLQAGGRLRPSGHYLAAEDLPDLADRLVHPDARRIFLCLRGGHDAQADIARWIELFAGWSTVFVLRTHALAARFAMQIGQPEVQREHTALAYDVAPGRTALRVLGAPLAASREAIRGYAGAMMSWLEAEAPANPARTGTDAVTASLLEDLHATRNQLREQEAGHQHDAARASAAEAEASALRATIERMKIQLSGLAERNAHLEAAAKAARPPLASWDDLEAWCTQALRGRIVLTSKAMQAARRSAFTDYTLAADVLELLGQDYTDMRRGVAGARERCEARQLALGVDIGPTGQAAHHHRYKREYQADWGRKAYRLDMHVSGHTTRDRTRCFRLYFAWSSEHALVVVGSFPEHLTNRAT